jgi:hypothetical protein
VSKKQISISELFCLLIIRYLLNISFTSKTEAERLSETSVKFYRTTRHVTSHRTVLFKGYVDFHNVFKRLEYRGF